MVQPIKNTYTQTKKKNKKKSIKNEVYGGLHIFAMCIAYSVWAVSTHTQDNPFQQDYNKSKPKTLALSLSSSSKPPSLFSRCTNTNKGGHRRSGTHSLSILFLYHLSMIPKFITLIFFFLCFLWKFSWTEF